MLHKDRIAVLIGRNGKTKSMIEKLTKTKIEIDSQSGTYKIYSIDPEINNDDAESLAKILEEKSDEDIQLNTDFEDKNLSIWMAQNIINAINYGFNPEKAIKLLDEEYFLEIIDLEKILGNSMKKIKRIKGRIIGEKGRMREAIEHFSGVNMVIYENYISLIGNFDSMKIAKKAINMLIEGLPHKVVYNFLQKAYQRKKDEEFRKNWKPIFD
ncbi:MAG: KH domain-containing protein [Promethearchaeota archaeon]